MFFWIVAALLTLAACMAVMAPLSRRRVDGKSRETNDVEVYRDQLAEVGRDASRGLIGANEADEARAEIARRILKTADVKQLQAERGGKLEKLVATAIVFAVPLVSWSIYASIGSPELPSQPLSARLSKPASESTPDELVARVELALRNNPADGRGWDVLAPVYLRLGRVEESVFAYRSAIQLLGTNSARESGLGEALSSVAPGGVTPEARQAFERALVLEPGYPKAVFFLGVADANEGKLDAAIARWTSIKGATPENLPWQDAAEQAIETARARIQTAVGAGPSGPSEEDIAASENMTPEERGAMIEGMVASLDEKLKANPIDPDGWTRLIRSYVVLGRQDAARDALARGIAALGKEDGERIRAEAASLGLDTARTP